MKRPETEKLLKEELRRKIDMKTKPPGALGQLEEIALRVGLIQNSPDPEIIQPHIVVFAGDHGIAATGLVNPYPQAVTAQMLLNFINGGAAINVFCRQHNIDLKVVDAGVKADLGDISAPGRFLSAKINYGTRNYLDEPAMSPEEMHNALEAGKSIVENIRASGCNCIGFGEMGIGNSSSAALIMSAITGHPIESCAGRGTAANDEQLNTKIETLRQVMQKHWPQNNKEPAPLDILQRFGGFEMAMMAGAYLKAAELNMVIVVDGFITTASLLIANALDADVLGNCIFAHTSAEKGHIRMLDYLGAKPMLNLGMRLGEGTGAALAIPLIQSAVNFLREMASFESAGVSNKEGA